MTGTTKRHQIERAKAREQMRTAEERRIADHKRKTELEKHYGLYTDPNDLCALDHKYDMMHEREEEEKQGWQDFSEKRVPHAERVTENEKKETWTALFNYFLDSSARYADKSRELEEIEDKYYMKISNMRYNLDYFLSKDEENGMPEKKLHSKRLVLMVNMCIDEMGTDFPDTKYLHNLEKGILQEPAEATIDKRELRLYDAMFKALKIAQKNGGDDADIRKEIETTGEKFLLDDDLKKLRQIKSDDESCIDLININNKKSFSK